MTTGTCDLCDPYCMADPNPHRHRPPNEAEVAEARSTYVIEHPPTCSWRKDIYDGCSCGVTQHITDLYTLGAVVHEAGVTPPTLDVDVLFTVLWTTDAYHEFANSKGEPEARFRSWAIRLAREYAVSPRRPTTMSDRPPDPQTALREASAMDRLQEAIEGERRYWHEVPVRPDDLSVALEYIATSFALRASVTPPTLDVAEAADDVRYADGSGTSDYWRGFNDGIDKLAARLTSEARDHE
jgi:hypothetical protein